MSIARYVRSRLSVKISLLLAALLLVLTGAAAAVLTAHETAQMEEMTLEKARLAATIGARQFGDVLDTAIDSGLLTVSDVFDGALVEIRGFNWAGKPKYHTRYDAYTDRAVLAFQDKFLEYEDFIFAVGVDVKGYLPTHNSRYQKPITGIPEQDLAGNRTKRVFDDPVGAAAAKNLQPILLQVYQRDTGETLWDVSSPIMVKGKHWGGFRIGVSLERIAARKATLLRFLAVTFAIFALVTIATMFLVIQRAMRPVVALTQAAEDISLGEGLDTPRRSGSSDEIGKLTAAVERLRVSMKSAISRLGG
jgi:HAMP domain-containing protein